MVRVSGVDPRSIKKSVSALNPGAISDGPQFDLAAFGADSNATMQNLVDAQRVQATIMNAERPSNLWYKMNGQSNWWYQYALMDWYKSEVSVLSTIINRSVTELFRYDLEFKPKFALKCVDCGYESQYLVDECPVCKSKCLRKPNPAQQGYFVRPNGKSFLEEANDNGQSLADVLKAYAESEYQNNQGYDICITGDIVDKKTGKLLVAYPLEFICEDPKFVRYLYDETGKPGAMYAFTREDRHMILDYTVDEDREVMQNLTHEGKELYPAYWQVGSNYGGTGNYILYSQEEIYQDHWFSQSLIYGTPIWFDIEDDLLTYHFLEKHFLKLYKFGYLRKIVILPGFHDEDVEEITAGIQDVLAKNDNSIPLVCLPPQMPNTAEMKAQTLELGAEDSGAAMQIKNDIRDRLCAHAGVPNIFAGDVEASGGMNNESQQITIFDRYLLDKFNRIDRHLKWILSWFPKITDWELVITRPSKAYTDARRRLERMEEASQMMKLGFQTERIGGEFFYSEQPIGQEANILQDNMQVDQLKSQMGGAANPDMGLMPGDGEGPPEKGTARREDEGIDAAKDEVELSMREAGDSAKM